MANDLRDRMIAFIDEHPSVDVVLRPLLAVRRGVQGAISSAGPSRSRRPERVGRLPRFREPGTIRAWWSPSARDRNFGDRLTAHLLRREGFAVEHTDLTAADVLCAGSVLELVPPGWDGVVFGAGLMYEHSRCDLGAASVLGLRGPLSAARCGVDENVPMFDPALLIEPPASPGSLIGVMPHYADRKLVREVRGDLVIDVTQDVDRVIEEVARCGVVHTSSLHGAILADAFGIPRVVHLSPAVRGSGFKFRDWDAAVAQRGIGRMRHDARVAFDRLCELARGGAAAALYRPANPDVT